jgi:hypothetical protein
MSLQFLLTTAGKNAIVNANNTGTNPITIAKVGIGSVSWTPTVAATALNTEIKKITATGGGAVADDTIHVTANDSSTDTYTVREIGLFTADNTLVAIYSQSSPIITKGSGTVALIAVDLVITGVPAGSVTVGDTTFSYPQATQTVKGVAEIATTAEVSAGTDDERIVTPAKLSAGYVKKAGDTMTGALTLPGDPTAGLHAATKEYVDQRTAGDTIPIGTVAYFSANTPPDSWLECNGQAVSRTTYDVLFARIGTSFGAGNGTTTFNIPDLRGEFIRGWDNGRGIDSGRAFGSFQGDTVGNHAHDQSVYGPVSGFDNGPYATSGTNQVVDASETRPRNVALLPCIKAKRLSEVDAALLGQAEDIYVRKTGSTMTGTLTGPGYIGNASTASQLATARSIALGGDLSGSASFSGAANVTINATVASASTTAAGKVELANNTETQTGTDTERAVTPAGLASVTATTTRAGLIELATQAETDTGTDTVRAVTPQTLRLTPGLSRAWVNFSGAGTVAIRSSHGVSSITDRGVGRYTINWDGVFGSSLYAFVGTARQINDVSDSCTVSPRSSETKTTSALQITVTEGSDVQDSDEICVVAFA